MLIGRARELARVDELVEAAKQGKGGALVIRGEPGIGKSALLRYARDRARDLAKLKAQGVQSEAELAFGGLSVLLAPILYLVDELPAPQKAALQGALALGPPGGNDRFAIYAATMGLFAAAAKDEPLLVLVDDAHWSFGHAYSPGLPRGAERNAQPDGATSSSRHGLGADSLLRAANYELLVGTKEDSVRSAGGRRLREGSVVA